MKHKTSLKSVGLVYALCNVSNISRTPFDLPLYATRAAATKCYCTQWGQRGTDRFTKRTKRTAGITHLPLYEAGEAGIYNPCNVL